MSSRIGMRSREDGRGVCVHEIGDALVVVSVPRKDLPEALSAAELEVAQLLAQGHSNAQIALARRSSERTVANQVASILKKLRAVSRVAAVAHLARR